MHTGLLGLSSIKTAAAWTSGTYWILIEKETAGQETRYTTFPKVRWSASLKINAGGLHPCPRRAMPLRFQHVRKVSASPEEVLGSRLLCLAEHLVSLLFLF